jgi:Nucleoside-diphosphate-sugar epimerases
MASVVWHSFSQIKNTGKIKLFRSHRQDFGDGEQCRDFIHVSDVVNVCFRWMNSGYSGLYNLGSGTASTFLELSNCIFQSLGIEKQIEWIDTPIEIRDSYQYFTQADMSWMRKQRWDHRFMSLPEGVSSYIKTLNDLESVPTDI